MEALSFVLPALLVLLFVPALCSLAPRLGLVNLPDARKRHAGPVPVVGGLAMFAALVLASLTLRLFVALPAGFLAGAVTIMLLGLHDDRRPLPVALRFLVQVLAIWFAVATSGNLLTDLGELVGPWVIALGALSVPVTVFCHLGLVNAFNLSDGADGLAGGVALSALFWYVVAFALLSQDGQSGAGLDDPIRALLALAGAVAGFLCFNMRSPWRARASVFMGDSGSLFLGFVLGWFGILAASRMAAQGSSPLCALWPLIVPVFDTVSCIVRRLLQGRSPTSPDHQHAHHLLQAWGLSHGRTVGVLVSINALGGMIGVTGLYLRWPEYWMFAAFVACFAAYTAAAMWSWSRLHGRRVGGALPNAAIPSSR